jgi:hypothetical protein
MNCGAGLLYSGTTRDFVWVLGFVLALALGVVFVLLLLFAEATGLRVAVAVALGLAFALVWGFAAALGFALVVGAVLGFALVGAAGAGLAHGRGLGGTLDVLVLGFALLVGVVSGLELVSSAGATSARGLGLGRLDVLFLGCAVRSGARLAGATPAPYIGVTTRLDGPNVALAGRVDS